MKGSRPGYKPNAWRIAVGSKMGALAVPCLVTALCLACLVLSRKVTDLKDELEQAPLDAPVTSADDSATISFYLNEHRDAVARHASFDSAASQPARMRVSRHDILYYESLDDDPAYMRPGIILSLIIWR